MARTPKMSAVLVLAVICAMAYQAATMLFANPSQGNLRSRVAMQAAAEKELELGVIKKEDVGKMTQRTPRELGNNPPKVEILPAGVGGIDRAPLTFSTGAMNEVSLLTPALETEDVKAWLSLNVNFFAILALTTAGAIIEVQRFFPDAMYW
eukprot:gb/GFBE01042415.1/.p1 GENE.gb/GFBE01042415.1/~~gb/GFBE01042415.1/.p1  ORF type:complete len:151 (+),score=42.00 gb/GFBE01042415.1/:1-453(+)